MHDSVKLDQAKSRIGMYRKRLQKLVDQLEQDADKCVFDNERARLLEAFLNQVKDIQKDQPYGNR